MDRRWMAGAALLSSLLAGCANGASNSAQATHVLAEKTARAVPPCSGWFVMSGNRITVHLALAAVARSADVVANESGWGDVDLGTRPITPGARNQTLTFTGVTDGVLSMTVHVQGGPSAGSCGIISPH